MPIPYFKYRQPSPRQQSTSHFSKKSWNFLTNHKKALVNFLLTILVGGAGLIIFGYFWLSKDLPNPQGVIQRNITTSTTIYDRTGKTVLYSVHGEVRRTLIQLQDLPPYVRWATIALEDQEFYQHSGISWKGTLRSIFVDLITGKKAQGGSTITQQFVKKAILTSEKSFIRKFKEWILAYRLEKEFSKDQILEMYFNEIPYGSVAYGIEAASQTYFGKSAKNLTLYEAAVLAALPQAPTYYSPYGNNRDALLARAQYALDQMVKLGKITREEAEQAKKQEIKFKPRQENILAPHFVMYIRELLAEKYGEQFIEQEGLKVYTTLDWDLQQKAEEILKEQVAKNKGWQANNAALVVLDATNGQILAMVGSADYFNDDIDGQVNVVLRPRQPGSSFKPIVYAAAFEKGYTPDTVVFDLNTKFLNSDGQDYEPHDYDNKERGPVTLRKALAGSLNIPAVKMIYLTGIDKVLDFADKLDYTTLKDRSRYGLSLVLGGGEVTLLEHAQAYSVFAQEGLLHPTNPILKVESKDGSVIEEFQKTEKQVLDAQVCRLLSSILTDNDARTYIFGAKNYLTLNDRLVAAKTGTTNNFRDAWTMGYTPSRVVGVWVGNSNNSAMKSGADGSQIAAPIWQKVMAATVAKIPAENFTAPDPINTDKPVLNGKVGISTVIKIDKSSGKLATALTPSEYILEKTITQYHNILYYVNKDDPQGPNPTNPSDDPQFSRWEEPVLRWVKQNNLESTTEIPTEQDTSHTLENQPSLIINTPQENQTIKEKNISLTITANAKRGINKLEVILDNKALYSGPFTTNLALDLNSFTTGFHVLSVSVEDDLGNKQTKSIDLNLLFQ